MSCYISFFFTGALSTAELLAAVQRTGWNAPATARQMVDHYAILDVAVDFSADELKRSYKALSKSTHPCETAKLPFIWHL
eukprot:SAG31_NODE_990_length_10529_cov_37.528340_4_plen_80_part_00